MGGMIFATIKHLPKPGASALWRCFGWKLQAQDRGRFTIWPMCGQEAAEEVKLKMQSGWEWERSTFPDKPLILQNFELSSFAGEEKVILKNMIQEIFNLHISQGLTVNLLFTMLKKHSEKQFSNTLEQLFTQPLLRAKHCYSTLKKMITISSWFTKTYFTLQWSWKPIFAKKTVYNNILL